MQYFVNYQTRSYRMYPLYGYSSNRNWGIRLWASLCRFLDGYRVVQMGYCDGPLKYQIFIGERGFGTTIHLNTRAMKELVSLIAQRENIWSSSKPLRIEVDRGNGLTEVVVVPRWAVRKVVEGILRSAAHLLEHCDSDSLKRLLMQKRDEEIRKKMAESQSSGGAGERSQGIPDSG